MSIPSDLKYSEDHEWVRVEGDLAVIGITDYAQGELGDVVYVDLPSIGDSFARQDAFGSIEAVKAASDLFSPIGGEVVEINESIEEGPEIINKDPYGDGWMIKVKISDTSDVEALMDASAYEAHINE